MEKQIYLAAVVQMNSQTDKAENLAAAVSLIEDAAARGAKLVALPEMMNYHGPEFVREAEEIPGGETFRLMSGLAQKHGIWLHCGTIFEQNPWEPNRPYNCCMLIAPSGKLAAKYRKMHMFDVDLENGGGTFRESAEKCSGDEIQVVKTDECGTLGLAICYDIRFPELYRLMSLNGAEVLFNPASFQLATGKDHWEPLLRARAIENSCYMLAPAQIGIKTRSHTYGKSMIVDPWGNVISMASDVPCVITAEINLEYRQTIKRQVLTLENRRRDVYTINYQGKQY